jgi:sugar phosphate permease
MQRRVGNLRWAIAILLGIGIVINYLDRVNISVATKPLEQQFHLSAGAMGIILSSFLWSYALLQIPIGWSLPGLIAPKGTVGSVGGIMNFFNNVAGIIAPIVVGFVFEATGSFAVNFLIAGAILVLGILSYVFLLGRIEQIQGPTIPSEPIEQPVGTRVG